MSSSLNFHENEYYFREDNQNTELSGISVLSGPSLVDGSSIGGANFLDQNPKHDKEIVQKLLDENEHIIEIIKDLLNLHKYEEVIQMNSQLHNNLVYLTTLANNEQTTSFLTPLTPLIPEPQGPIPIQVMSIQNSVLDGLYPQDHFARMPVAYFFEPLQIPLEFPFIPTEMDYGESSILATSSIPLHQ